MSRTTNPRGQCVSRATWSPHERAPGTQFVTECIESGCVRFSPCADYYIPCRQRFHQLPAPHFLEAPAQTIAGHPGGLELWNDESHPRMARWIFCPHHVEMAEPPPSSRSQHSRELGHAREPTRAQPALVCRQRPPCFEGTLIVKRLRPFLRRRDSTSRPQRSAMRARKPCRLSRLRLRGR